ncbi:unnamed protein product [Meloidogyne enterolobii]|uniref:Uncharacterized protein n=1 Tax=Meloidogyne enterolobii TaxID=390850 RepID=A0ACB0ZMY0_MELEN
MSSVPLPLPFPFPSFPFPLSHFLDDISLSKIIFYCYSFIFVMTPSLCPQKQNKNFFVCNNEVE